MCDLIKVSSYEIIRKKFEDQNDTQGMTFQKECSFAIQAIIRNPKLKDCTLASVQQSVMNAAQLGLTLNHVAKLCYLVPRHVRGRWEAVLFPSYMGLIHIVTDTGAVRSMESQLIYDGDDFEIDFSSKDKIKKHVPAPWSGNERGELLGVYSKAVLPDGSTHVELMPIDDVWKIRERSDGYRSWKNGKARSCVWDTDEGQMVRKTPIKRHINYLPKGNNAAKIGRAIQLEEAIGGFRVGPEKAGVLESKVLTSHLPEYEKDLIINEIPDMMDEQANAYFQQLDDKQLPPNEKPYQNSQDFQQQFEDKVNDPNS